MEGYTKLVIVMALTSMIAVANAQMCKMSQPGFNACKPAVSTNNPQPPSKECCDAIRGADLTCLCAFANSPIVKSFNINKDAAMGLPVNCKVDPNFHC